MVAFSAAGVYGIAELLRRQRGGAAVVMGALSPRTRNAQVAMFQNGEVDYLVATDAIGMGLNMDVSHVAFGELGGWDTHAQEANTLATLFRQLGDARAGPGLLPAELLRHRADVLGDGPVREQAGLLDDITDPAAQFVGREGGLVLAEHLDATARRLNQPVDHLERRRLAAAGRPDQYRDLALAQFERQRGDGGVCRPGEVLGDLIEADRDRSRVGRRGGLR